MDGSILGPRPIVVSLFPNEHTSIPQQRTVAGWLELGPLIGAHRVQGTKSGPMFSPAEWTPGVAKTKANVLRVHFGVLDLDDISTEALEEVVANLKCPYVVASTWHHGDCGACKGTKVRTIKNVTGPCAKCNATGLAVPGDVRVRLVVPFSRPVEAAEWPRFWAMFGQVVGLGHQDESCKDPNRCSFFPSHPTSPAAPPIYRHGNHYAAPIDVDDLLARAPAPRVQDFSRPLYANAPANATEALTIALNSEGMQYEGAPLSVFDLRQLVRKWSKSGAYKKWLATVITKICDGEAFADDGERDSTLYKVCAALSGAFPHASAAGLAAIMAPALEAMGLDGPGAAEAYEKIRRKQAEPRLAATGRIAELFNDRRATPYTPEEIAAFAEQMECTVEQFHRRWIIQRGGSFYLFVGDLDEDLVCRNGNYIGPYTREDAANACRRELAPACVNVLLDLVTATAVRAKTIHELVKDYGTVATQAIIDLTADFSYYEARKRQFVEATAPMRDLTPLYDHQVEAWLFALAGPHFDRLCEWIAAVTFLSEPCAALYLEGAKGVGKTLLALGVSRIWSTNGPTDLEQALASFNESLCHNPLTFGDEHVPTDGRGRMRTAELREFIQSRQRVLKRKFMHPQTMIGCARVILAANNKNLIHTSESLTQHDVLALAERIFHLPVQEAAVAYLKTIKDAEPGITRRWVEGDLIARHALWLRDEITIDRRNRFLVSGEGEALARTLTVNDRMKSAVCNWIVAWMLDQEKLAQTPLRDRIRIEDSKLFVNSQVLVEKWDLYTTNEEPPPTGKIYRALADIAIGERINKRDASGNGRHYREIDVKNLVSWAEQSGYATEQTLRDILAKGTS